MSLEIIKEGNPILRQVAESIDFKSNTKINDLICDMIDTLKLTSGVGLAAPQVGVSKRLIIIKDMDNIGAFFEMINPEIVWTSFDKQFELEGCLSILGEDNKPIHKRVPRYKRIRVKWEDKEGNLHEELIKNPLKSRIIQHEIDHLNGKLFIDYLD